VVRVPEPALDLDYADRDAAGWNALSCGDGDWPVGAAEILTVTAAEGVVLAELARWRE
jgi:hypothetical protein